MIAQQLPALEPPDLGDTRAELWLAVEQGFPADGAAYVGLIGGLIAEQERHPELIEAFRRGVLARAEPSDSRSSSAARPAVRSAPTSTRWLAYATDPAQLTTWQTNTVSSVPEEDGPLRVGSRLREVHRAPGGKQLESVVEVSEYEPDRTFALRVVEGTPVHARLTFEPAERGTLLRFGGHGQLTGVQRLAQPLLQRVLKRQFATLKCVLEQRELSTSS